MNIGGISNITLIKKPIESFEFFSKDVGPGNCLIDSWIRKNSNKKFDRDGVLAASGNKNEIIFEQAQELYRNRKNKEKNSLDTNDFDISFSRGLSLEDGASTLTEFTASILGESISIFLNKINSINIFMCGGGRKNKTLVKALKKNLTSSINLKLIEELDLNGDFIESQAFAFLSIRSIMNLPITFPNTTNCLKPVSGGEMIEN